MNDTILYLASIQIGTQALGPGFRAGIWVQGCPFSCRGCISPEWTLPGGQAISVDELVHKVLADPRIEGLTLSGGEPMQQASALAKFVQLVKIHKKDINTICFTGYRLEDLRKKPHHEGVDELLAELDLLIDGPYIDSMNNGIGLRGSSNQIFHYLTDKFRDLNLETKPRRVEVNLQDGQALIVGIPPRRFGLSWNNAMVAAQKES